MGSNHFADVGKMVNIDTYTVRKINDIKFTRYACYLTAKNVDYQIQYSHQNKAPTTLGFKLIPQHRKGLLLLHLFTCQSVLPAVLHWQYLQWISAGIWQYHEAFAVYLPA